MADTTSKPMDPMEAAAGAYRRYYADTGKWSVEVALHAYLAALAENIPPEMVEAACDALFDIASREMASHFRRDLETEAANALRAALLSQIKGE